MPGIGPIRAGRIAATWAEQRQIREVMTVLQSYGVSTSLAVRIYQQYRDESIRVLAREPYRLAREVWGIGFKTADRIARAVGIPEDAPARLEAGTLFALSAAADDGHTLLPESELTGKASELLDVEAAPIQAAITSLLNDGDLVAWLAQDNDAEDRLVVLALCPGRARTGRSVDCPL